MFKLDRPWSGGEPAPSAPDGGKLLHELRSGRPRPSMRLPRQVRCSVTTSRRLDVAVWPETLEVVEVAMTELHPYFCMQSVFFDACGFLDFAGCFFLDLAVQGFLPGVTCVGFLVCGRTQRPRKVIKKVSRLFQDPRGDKELSMTVRDGLDCNTSPNGLPWASFALLCCHGFDVRLLGFGQAQLWTLSASSMRPLHLGCGRAGRPGDYVDSWAPASACVRWPRIPDATRSFAISAPASYWDVAVIGGLFSLDTAAGGDRYAYVGFFNFELEDTDWSYDVSVVVAAAPGARWSRMAATSTTALDSPTPCFSLPLAGDRVLLVLAEASCAWLAVSYANVAALVLRGLTGCRTWWHGEALFASTTSTSSTSGSLRLLAGATTLSWWRLMHLLLWPWLLCLWLPRLDLVAWRGSLRFGYFDFFNFMLFEAEGWRCDPFVTTADAPALAVVAAVMASSTGLGGVARLLSLRLLRLLQLQNSSWLW